MKPSMDVIIAAMKETGDLHSILLYGLKEETQKEIIKALLKAFPIFHEKNFIIEFNKNGKVDGNLIYCLTYYRKDKDLRYICYSPNDGGSSIRAAITAYNGDLVRREFIKWEPTDERTIFPDIWS